MNIFVYGSLKKGKSRNCFLEKQVFVKEISTKPIYRLYNLGMFPAMVEDVNGISIKGELWEVDDECLKFLDLIEAHPLLFHRKRVDLNEEIDAQAYLFPHPINITKYVDCGESWQ